MQIWDPIATRVAEFATNFKNPEFLWGIPILLLIILILVSRNFVRYSMDDRAKKKLRRMRILVFLLRSAAVTLILIALATPFTTISQESEGNPRALVLIDESGSMELYDTSFTTYLTDELSKRIPTSVKTFGTEISSPVGDAALGHPEHLLLISDGNANTGVQLRDVAQVARQNNLTLSTVEITPVKHDAAVTIDAPRSIPLGFPATIRVQVTDTNGDPAPLTVIIDGAEVFTGLVSGIREFEPELGTGYHRIEARITSDDANENNNAHYRVIEVLEKPKIFVLSGERGPLETALTGLFDTTVANRLPADMTEYTAVVVNDQKAATVGTADKLADFLRDEQGGKYGNGLVVVGGFNSYDRGGYQNTQLESLLPVKVGKPKRELGDNSLVFVIQVSGSTGGTKFVSIGDGQVKEVKEDIPIIDIIKAQAVSAIESLNLKNNVGLIIFGADTTGESYGSAEEAMQASVVRVANVEPLYKHKKELVDAVEQVQGGGTTAPDLALRAAVEMLKGRSGSRTIIFLSNGRFSAGLGDVNAGAKADVESVIANAFRRYGIKTHVIGVGSNDYDAATFQRKVDEPFLINMAQRSDGLYDRATNMVRLMLEYGDPNEKGFGDNFFLVTMSLTHFITKDLDLDAVLNGYNEVAPKDGSRILVKTDSGAPALTTWNYFNGRVAALNVFTASGLGPLLSGDNSDLVRNTVLWAIGDPTRKQAVTVSVSLAITEHETDVTFTSQDPVSGNCQDTPVAFSRGSGNTYVFTFDAGAAGFHTVCGVPYAVNDESEHWKVGVNQDLIEAVQISDGQVFVFDQIDEIVERIKTVSTRVSLEKTEVRNPFIGLALILFLIEIFIRRLTKYTG